MRIDLIREHVRTIEKGMTQTMQYLMMNSNFNLYRKMGDEYETHAERSSIS